MRAIFLIYGNHEAQLDHLASLASLLKLPLYVTDLNIFETAKIFYPFTDTYLIDETSLLSFLVSHDFIFVSCKHFSTHLSATLHFFYKKSPRFCYCPHGNSDKGWSLPGDLLHQQDLSLVYGKLMLAMLKNKGVLSTLKGTCVTGNYRWLYYQQNQLFYDSLAEKKIFSKLKKSSIKLLYTPTWKDGENNSSFYDLAPRLIKDLPQNLELFIKLHPTLEKEDPAAIDHFITECKKNPQIHLIHHFPPIYPILKNVDALLTDISSIGYDYLSFNKSLYLIPPAHITPPNLQRLPLASCSRIFKPREYAFLLSNIEKNIFLDQKAFEKKRQKLYAKTFENSFSQEAFRETLFEFMKQHA